MDKPLELSFRHMESSEFLEAHIRDRVDRLERFNDRITSCRVVVEVPHRAPAGGKVPIGIAVEVDVPGRPTLVAKEDEELHDAKNDRIGVINRAFDRVQRQLEEDARVRKGHVKAHEAAGSTGIVARLFPEQNYGFIEVAGAPDLYFTRNAVLGDAYDDLEEGMQVRITIATTEGPMGPQASSVQKLGAETDLQ